MGVWKEKLTPVERRMKARFIRYLTERTEKNTMEQAATAHHVSRAYAYQILAELDKWEAAHTFEQEVAELHSYRFGPNKDGALNWDNTRAEQWFFLSGRAINAYVAGEIDNTLIGAPHADRAPSIGVVEAIGQEPNTDDDDLLK